MTQCLGDDLEDSLEGPAVVRYLTSHVMPKLQLGRLNLRRNESERKPFSARVSNASTRVPSVSSSRCSSARDVSARAPSAPSRCLSARISARVTAPLSTRPVARRSKDAVKATLCSDDTLPSSRCQSARCSSASSVRPRASADLMALPGSLRLTRRTTEGSDSSDSPAADVSPALSFFGWPSPAPSARTYLGRLKKDPKEEKVNATSVRSHSEPSKPISARSQPEVSKPPTMTILRAESPPAAVPKEAHPLTAFSRLRMGKLAEIRNRMTSASKLGTVPVATSQRRFGNGFNEDAQLRPWHGILSEEEFAHYDVDKNGRLGPGELGCMLRDHGMCLDYARSCRVLQMIAGSEDAESVGFEGFAANVLAVIDKRRGSGGEASEVLRCVFRSYDINKSGMLDVNEYTKLLTHLGRRPKTQEDWQAQSKLIACCRKDAVEGPLDFQEFVVLVHKVHNANQQRIRA